MVQNEPPASEIDPAAAAAWKLAHIPSLQVSEEKKVELEKIVADELAAAEPESAE